jgi:hypothetical protein
MFLVGIYSLGGLDGSLTHAAVALVVPHVKIVTAGTWLVFD